MGRISTFAACLSIAALGACQSSRDITITHTAGVIAFEQVKVQGLPAGSTVNIGNQAGNRQTRVVFAGKETEIGHWYSLKGDCSLNTVPVGTITVEPKYGTAVFRVGSVVPNYPKSNPRSACNSRQVKGLILFYRADKEFSGVDSVGVKVVAPPDMDGIWGYGIKVEQEGK